MIVGAAVLTVGLFCFAFTSSPHMNPWPQILSGLPIGFGIQAIILQALAYVIDVYLTNANSAISGTVVVRSLVGGTFPLFALRMYQQLHVSHMFSMLHSFIDQER
jgi:DHA1 family multidrug resistance protein-like MFS transporter